MSIVKEKYRRSLVEEILLRYLHRNRVPSAATLQREHDELVRQYPLLEEQPFVRAIQPLIERHENLTASKYNAFWRRLYKDYSVLYKALAQTLERVVYIGQAWDLFYNRSNVFMDRIEDRVDNLLLVKSSTTGFLEYVKDDFFTNEFVNTNSSTIELNTARGIVTLPIITGVDSTTFDRVDINTAAVRTSATINHSTLVSNVVPNDVEHAYIVDDKNKPWYTIVATSSNSPSVTADIVVDLGTKYEFNNVNINPYHASTRSSLLITLFYSADGVDWVKAGSAHTQNVTSNGTWLFDEVNVRYLRMLINKPTFDQITSSGSYIWTIGFNSIELYRTSYAAHTAEGITSGLLQTTALEISDNLDGTKNGFNKAMLQACEILPPNTDILYELSVDGNTYIPIANADRSQEGIPSIVNFGTERRVHTTNEYSLFSSSWPNKGAEIVSSSYYSTLDPAFASTAAVNLYVPVADVANIERSSIQLWRNVGRKESPLLTNLTVRDANRGWHMSANDSAIISTNVLVIDPAGADIDFGPNGIYLDGVKQTGLVHLTSGSHSIETNSSNYVAITSGLIDDAKLSEIDPLFPYNHKYLIEGYTYANADSTGIYIGVDLFAEKLVTRIPVYRYNVLNELDLDVFTIDTRRTGPLAGVLQFFVMIDTKYSDYENEKFEVSYVLNDASFTNLYMRAKLTSTVVNSTPILKDYMLKVS